MSAKRERQNTGVRSLHSLSEVPGQQSSAGSHSRHTEVHQRDRYAQQHSVRSADPPSRSPELHLSPLSRPTMNFQPINELVRSETSEASSESSATYSNEHQTQLEGTSMSRPTELTPRLTINKGEDEFDIEAGDSASEEESLTSEGQPKTAAEILSDKRRMRRFRLTHGQTRFLLSEFARQPHPNAADRARLSREIPGLSPRQAQVWFQNRRAKQRRLSNNDQESVVRSRVLPMDFGYSQTLASPLGEQHHSSRIYLPPTNGSTFGGGYRTGGSVQDLHRLSTTSVYGHSSNLAPGSHLVSPHGSLDDISPISGHESIPSYSRSPSPSQYLRSYGRSHSFSGQGNQRIDPLPLPNSLALSAANNYEGYATSSGTGAPDSSSWARRPYPIGSSSHDQRPFEKPLHIADVQAIPRPPLLQPLAHTSRPPMSPQSAGTSSYSSHGFNYANNTGEWNSGPTGISLEERMQRQSIGSQLRSPSNPSHPDYYSVHAPFQSPIYTTGMEMAPMTAESSMNTLPPPSGNSRYLSYDQHRSGRATDRSRR